MASGRCRQWVGRLGLIGMLAACSAQPLAIDPATRVAVPAGWSASEAAGAGAAMTDEAALSSWWLRFDDPQLAALVAEALNANTRVLGAVAALRQAEALRDVAAAALWPTLDASASTQRPNTGGHNVQAGVDGNWVIDIFGARRAAIDAGASVARASAASLGDIRVQIAAEVALNYILLRTAEARSAIAAGNLLSQQETLQITRWRQQAGLVTVLETDQAQAAVEQNRAQLPLLQTSIVQTRHALAVLGGQPPEALPAAVAAQAVARVPQARDGLRLRIPAETLRQRADVRAAEYQVAAALARVGQARAQRWPSFSIGGSLGVGTAAGGAIGTGSAVLASLLASVTLPLFDGGARRAQVRVQQAALAQAEQVYRAAVLGALQQVEDARVALHGDRLRLDSLQRASIAAADAAGLARQRYRSGLIDFQSVLETQRTQFATEDGVASARADLGRDQVQLFKALGGGWSDDPGVPSP